MFHWCAGPLGLGHNWQGVYYGPVRCPGELLFCCLVHGVLQDYIISPVLFNMYIEPVREINWKSEGKYHHCDGQQAALSLLPTSFQGSCLNFYLNHCLTTKMAWIRGEK